LRYYSADGGYCRTLVRVNNLPDLPDNSARKRNYTGLDKLAHRETADPIPFPVHESMIDVNQHLNNAHYVTHVFDWLAKKTGTIPEIREIQVNFIAATVVGALLCAQGAVSGKNFYVECLQDGELHFQAEGFLS